MFPVLLAAVVTTGLVGAHPDATNASVSPSAHCEALAERLRIAPVLRPVVIDMCQRAPTFRRQVVRIAGQPGLDVTISPGLFPSTGRTRARTALTRIDGRLRTAAIEVPAGDSMTLVELVAHEFEHVLEQIDGVDLAQWVGRSGVYRVGTSDRDGPIETERARRVGRLVAGEYGAATARITAIRTR